MEKLIELLNEHAHTYADHYDDTGEEITIEFYGHADECFQYVCDSKYETLVDDTVISKRFGFISWLVENDKIDFSRLDAVKSTNNLIMALAIQDEPIRFLCEILK